MSRHLPILGLIVLPALVLSACDSSSTLSKAKPGECYAVVGRDALGAPSLAKTPCAGSPAALAAACPTPAPAAAAVASCPTTKTKAATSGHRASGASARRSVKVAQRTRSSSAVSYASARDDRVAKSGEVTSLGIEYARVGQDLAGGPGYQADYERHESYGRVDHAPPPRPHRPRVAQSGASIEYSERSRQSSSYSESYSSSSSSRGYGEGYCDCDGRGAPPHSPFDRYGYLTWRGKTPG